MKILLFTHKNDIDGAGCAVFAKLAFSNATYVLCETYNLKEQFFKYYNDKSIYDYDKIFVTDLCLDEETLNMVSKDEMLKSKLMVFDHHASVLDRNSFEFVNVIVKNSNGLCCGTSLFYDYLVNTSLLNKNNKALYEFSELTRKHDTWEWKTKYENDDPYKLATLFNVIGVEAYIDLMYNKLLNSPTFSFDSFEDTLITNEVKKIDEKMLDYSKKVFYKNILGLKAGIVFIEYKYRNDIAQYFKDNNYDMDFAMLIAIENGSISYRSVKDDVNVRIVAEHFGGGGHDKASSSPITPNTKEEIINMILNLKG